MGSQALNAADHGRSAGAQQALNMLALFRTGPLVACRPEKSISLVFVLEGVAPQQLCGCDNPECRVDELLAVWQELLTASGEHSDEQAELAYQAYRVAESLCSGTSCKGLHIPNGGAVAQLSADLAREHAYQRYRDDADRGREFARDSY